MPINLYRLVLLSTAVTALWGCTWVSLDAGGRGVRVIDSGQSEACVKRGEIEVSVRDQVGLLERNPMKVRDELETLARNEAATMSADSVQALGEPLNGEQRFAALACAGVAVKQPAAAQPNEPAAEGTAETFPVRGG